MEQKQVRVSRELEDDAKLVRRLLGLSGHRGRWPQVDLPEPVSTSAPMPCPVCYGLLSASQLGRVGPSLYVLSCHIQIEVHNIIWEEDVIWAQKVNKGCPLKDSGMQYQWKDGKEALCYLEKSGE